MDLSKIAKETEEKVLGYLESTDGWTVSPKSTNDMQLEVKPSPDFKGSLYRVTHTLNGNYKDLSMYMSLNTLSWKAEWDKDIVEKEVLRQIEENTQLIRRATNSLALGIISSRDFVEVVKSKVTDTYVLVVARSVDLPEYPPVEKCVRATAYPWGLRCQQDSQNPKRTKFQSIMQLDLKGKIPTTLVETTLPSLQLGVHKNYENCVREKGLLQN